MADLVIHTIDGRRHVWRNVEEGWLQSLADQDPNDFVICSEDEPIIRVGAIASIDIVKEGEK